MIGYFPYFTLALLLIYPHSTTRSFFMDDPQKLENLLDYERESDATDIICNSFTPKQRQYLCDEAMEHMLRENHRIDDARLGSFLKKKSTLPVHESAKSFAKDPYTCQKKSISANTISMDKHMYYCIHRVYRKQNSAEIQVSGFFVSGSRTSPRAAFLFIPVSLTSKNVLPRAKLSEFEQDLDRIAERANDKTPFPWTDEVNTKG